MLLRMSSKPPPPKPPAPALPLRNVWVSQAPVRAQAHPRRLVAGERRGSARAAPARRRPALPDGIDRAAVAALRPDVDRRSRAIARPARPLPGPRSAQTAHRAAPTAGALALAPDACLHRALDGARATRRPHRRAAVRGKAQGVPPQAGNAVGARALKAASYLKKINWLAAAIDGFERGRNLRIVIFFTSA